MPCLIKDYDSKLSPIALSISGVEVDALFDKGLRQNFKSEIFQRIDVEVDALFDKGLRLRIRR